MGADNKQQAFIDDLMGALGADVTDPNNAEGVGEDPEETPEATPEEGTEPEVEEEEDDLEIEDEELEEDEGEDSDYEDLEEEPEEDDEEGEEPESSDELEQLRQQNKELMQQLNTIASTMMAQQRVNTGEADVPEDKGLKKPEAKDFLLSEDELDRILDEPELFNQAIERMFSHMSNYVEQVTSTVPQTVQQHVDSVTATKNMVDEFYQQNPDLAEGGRKRFVQMMFSEELEKAQAAGRTVDFNQLLKQTAKSARRELGLKSPKRVVKQEAVKDGKTVKVAKKGKKQPTMPGAKSGRKGKGGKPKSKRTAQQQMIDELL